MKAFCLIVSMLVSAASFGKVWTVSNNPAAPAQFTDVNAAVTAATAGDTIYVHGTQFTYPDFSINKKLVMIGAGFNSNNQFNFATRVNIISLVRDTGLQNASGSVITGFYILSNIIQSGTLTSDNVTVFRNYIGANIYLYISGSLLCNNWTIYNNIINTLYGGSGGPLTPSATNCTISNNIFFGGIANFSQASILIDHNVVLGQNSISGVYYATFTNNVFTMSAGNIITGTVTSNTFNNNLSLLTTIGPSSPTNSFLGGPNTGTGNFVGVDPQFVSVSSYNSYIFSADYHLKTASAGHNAGTDGTDLGIYGGSFPFPTGGTSGSGFETSPLPPIPQVTDVNIQNPSLQAGTPLNVNIKAKINN